MGRYVTQLRDDDELNINPPTPCQIGKRPPAPKPKRESAGHQGAAGGGYCVNATAGEGLQVRLGVDDDDELVYPRHRAIS